MVFKRKFHWSFTDAGIVGPPHCRLPVLPVVCPAPGCTPQYWVTGYNKLFDKHEINDRIL
jgi:hypothetical protein